MKKSLSKAVTLSILAAFCGGMFYTTEVQAKQVLRLETSVGEDDEIVLTANEAGLMPGTEWKFQDDENFYVIRLKDTSGVAAKTINQNNEIIVDVGGVFKADIYGAYADGSNNENVLNNAVRIFGSASENPEVQGNIFGGYSNNNTSDVNNNEVSITNIKIGGSVYGGWTDSKSADNNIVLLENVAVNGDIYGGRGKTSAKGNNISILDSTVQGKTYGGWADTGEASKNILKISNITAEDSIYGGYSDNGSANENIVNVENSKVAMNVYGAFSNKGDADGNIVNIDANSNVGTVTGAHSSYGEAKNNIVNFNSGFADSLTGGYVHNGSANNNLVNMSGGVANTIYGGAVRIISDNNIKEVSGNKVKVSGGVVDIGRIIGGYINTNIADCKVTAKDNVVELSGNANVSNALLYGYCVEEWQYNDVKIDASNNQLIINNWEGGKNTEGNTVKKLANFNSIKIVDTSSVNLFAEERSDLSNTIIYLQSLGSDKPVGYGTTLTVGIKNIDFKKENIRFFDDENGKPTNRGYTYSDNGDNGVRVHELEFTTPRISDGYQDGKTTIFADGTVKKSVLTGVYIDKDGAHYNSEKEGLTIDGELSTNAEIISGSYAKAGNDASNGVITISGKPDTSNFEYADKTIYAGYAEAGNVNNNSIILEFDADVSDWNLYGYNTSGSNNSLTFNNWTLDGERTVNSVNNFAELKFNNIGFDKVFAANETSDLSGAKIIIEDTSNNGYVDVGAALEDDVDYAVGAGIEKNILTLQNIKITEDNVQGNVKNNKGKTEKINDKGVGVRVHEIALLNEKGESQKDVPWSVKPIVTVEGNNATIGFKGEISKSIYTNSYSTSLGGNVTTYTPAEGLFTIDEEFTTNADIISGSYAKADITGADNDAGSGLVVIGGDVDKNKFAYGNIYGGYAEKGTTKNNLVILEAGANVDGDVTIYGGYSENGAVKSNSIILGEGVKLLGDVTIYAGYSEKQDNIESVANNSVTIKDGVDISKLSLYGYNKTHNGNNIRGGANKLIIDGWGGGVKEIANFSQIEFQNLDDQVIESGALSQVNGAKIVITGINFASDATKVDAADIAKFSAANDDKGHEAGDYAVDADYREATLTLENFTLQDAEADAAKLKANNSAIDNIVFDGEQINKSGSGVRVHQFKFTKEQVTEKTSVDGKPVIEIAVGGTIEKSIYANKYVDSKGGLHTGIGDFVIDENFKTNANIIAGAYIVKETEQTAEEAGSITISGNVDVNNFKHANANVYAGYAESGTVKNNSITVEKGADITALNLYGYNSTFTEKDGSSVNITGTDNKLILNGWTGTVNSLNNFSVIEINNIAQDSEINSTVLSNLDNTQIVIKGMNIDNGNGDYAADNSQTYDASLTLKNFESNDEVDVQYDGEQINDSFADGGVRVHHFDFSGQSVDKTNADGKPTITIKFSGNIEKSIYANRYIDRAGNIHTGAKDFVIDENFGTKAGIIAGSYGAIGEGVIERAATKGNITIKGNVDVSQFEQANGIIYAGYVEKDNDTDDIVRTVQNNSITLDGANAGEVSLYGYNDGDNIRGSNNSVIVTGGANTIGSINNFSNISFKNIAWQDDATILTITGENNVTSSLDNTKINLEGISFKGGENFKAGESMTLIDGNEKVNGLDVNNVIGSKNFSAGVALVGKGTAAVEDGNLTYTITEKRVNSQVDIVAESRALSAALINQGGDIIADGIASLTQDANYGTKTFAAVYGNRSKYDASSDAKINGWSGIFGVGSEKKIADGDLSWGVFFEKGNGDYHVNNKFEDEYFRSDGSLKYNGGGIMARMEQDNDVYYEASLRAGKIESEMTNALKESKGGASYGYKSESTYYGAHLGVGKVITIDSEQELDVYGKYFHTYTDGDSFTVAGDKFEFDSVTSDRVQIGARLTTNKNNKWSTYYGLAYEYEFNGDAKMKAAGMNAPTQSLQGSTLIGEIGLHFAENKKSPWSMDAKLRGYAGEREGFSGNIQVNYSF